MPDEVSIAGSFNMERDRQSKGVFRRMLGHAGGTSGTVSASLKFDIPGLKDFKTQLDAINASLTTLNTTFTKLAKAPETFSKSLEGVVKQMKALQAMQLQSNRFVTTGTPPSKDPVGQATAAAQVSGGGAGTGGTGGGPGGTGAAAAGGEAAKDFVSKAVTAMFKRFDAGMQQAIASDVYVSRMTTYSGAGNPTTPAGIFRKQGKEGFGFMATDMTQAERVLYTGTGIGAYYGAAGRAGQAGDAYATSIKQMQETMPGLDAEQGAAGQSAIYNNVQGIKLARIMLGGNVSPYTATGERKTQNDYFRDILKALQKLPRPNGKHGAWSKDDIMKMNFPGSRLNAWLSAILPEEVIPMWMDWAITNAAVSDAGQGQLSSDPKVAKKQREAVFGRSLATNAQETTNREAQKDATFAGQQYGTMNARLDYEKDMLGVLQSIDTGLKPLYAVLGRAPSMLQSSITGLLGGLAGGLVGGGLSLLGGDPGYMPMGDPEGGTSHLTPDLRKRVNAMMAANPNLKISSAYRDTRRQESLQGKGPFAPAGKSEHGKGRAVDFRTQLGWVAKNARKFGLETAARYGEPWHVQLAGTTTMGDPGDPSASARSAESSLTSKVIDKTVAAVQAKKDAAAAAAAGSPTSSPPSGAGAPGALDLGKGSMSAEQVVQALHNAGFTGDALVTMAGIGNRESSWTPSAHRTNNPSKTGVDAVGDFGLFQINYSNVPSLVKAGVISNVQDLLDPNKNAAAAYYLSKGGTSLAPWTAGKGGWIENGNPMFNVKQSALDAAKSAAQGLGYIGDPGFAPQMGGGGSTHVSLGGGTSVTFNNVFQLSFPNGTSQTSIDVATRQIAQRLEPQMRRMVSRNS